ncbi:MAG: hypothetical protein SH818_17420 [Saprospiraceae bacterium]|nr:hypothetical protein [Saprospiraceae bacterium]
MKNLKYFFLGLIAFSLVSCETDIIDVVDEFTFESGGYMRTVTPFPVVNATFSVSKANPGGTKMELVAEAVTKNFGALFANYDMVIKFVDNSPANGNKSTTDKTLKSYTASQFTKDPVTSYPRATVTVTGAEALTATGLTVTDVTKGDFFTISATMVLTDGKKFNAANTGLNITGGAFYSSPFSYRINVAD